MQNELLSQSLMGLRKADASYKRIVELSEIVFGEENLMNREAHMRDLQFFLESVKGKDSILTIFNHKAYYPEMEVGELEFWGEIPNKTYGERMKFILGLLHTDYANFPLDSVKWLTTVISAIPFDKKVNMKTHHCCMRFIRMDGKQIRLFSQGIPIQVDENRNFKYSFNYVQNINNLIKRDFPHYWIRLSYGEHNEFVHTFHSEAKEYSARDLLSPREKEILLLIAEGMDTKEIAKELYISVNTVGNHRSNMIDRLGARDTTALVQLAKMVGMI
jgi:DNA-binding CsgD family transcriptional regulator